MRSKSPKSKKQIKDPRTAALLSLLPGLGHLYLGNLWRGIGLATGYIFCLWIFMEPTNYAQPPSMPVLGLIWLVLSSLFWVYAARDAYMEAKKTMEEAPKKR